ncbi:hypothetical protein RF11_03557 [Thelohanellus kitauei]|uniref:Uncharacterized protein n=1 Tax=Thelohanellus kitauei TaxID=669202 RepID=A0A0C2IV67_THEKT|nr:hypothetical protein RF11_03557 [Thelohanellus kitauei]
MSPNQISVAHSRVSRDSAELPIKAALSQSCFSSRPTNRGYIGAVDLCLKASKEQCGHRGASEESKRVSEHLECKRSFKIRGGLVWLVRTNGLFTLAALREAVSKILLPRD